MSSAPVAVANNMAASPQRFATPTVLQAVDPADDGQQRMPPPVRTKLQTSISRSTPSPSPGGRPPSRPDSVHSTGAWHAMLSTMTLKAQTSLAQVLQAFASASSARSLWAQWLCVCIIVHTREGAECGVPRSGSSLILLKSMKLLEFFDFEPKKPFLVLLAGLWPAGRSKWS